MCKEVTYALLCLSRLCVHCACDWCVLVAFSSSFEALLCAMCDILSLSATPLALQLTFLYFLSITVSILIILETQISQMAIEVAC
jgi:hypothetical protein